MTRPCYGRDCMMSDYYNFILQSCNVMSLIWQMVTLLVKAHPPLPGRHNFLLYEKQPPHIDTLLAYDQLVPARLAFFMFILSCLIPCRFRMFSRLSPCLSCLQCQLLSEAAGMPLVGAPLAVIASEASP